VQRALGGGDGLDRALKQLPSVIGLLRMSFPQQAQKLASSMYWMIVHDGEASDMDRFERLFGKPADDPDFYRMRALVMEGLNSLEDANHFWSIYAEWIEKSPQRWPREQAHRARAMILMRMGDNARRHLEGDDDMSFDDYFEMILEGPDGRGGRRGKRQSLQPAPDACYRRAMELAPGWKEPAVRLMKLHEEEENWEAAEAIGAKILKDSPDDVPTLIAVSSIQQALGKADEALANMKHALKNNPLDRALRMGVGSLTLEFGRSCALSNEFDAARQALAEAAAHAEAGAGPKSVIVAVIKAALAACEFKAKNRERAEQLAAETVVTSNFVPASAYAIFVESGRIKLDKPTLRQFQARCDEALEGRHTIPEVINLLHVLDIYQKEPQRYRGIGPHNKKIAARAAEAVEGDASEGDLCQIGEALSRQKASKILKACAERGIRRFPGNPYFRSLLGEYLIMQRPQSFNEHEVCFHFREVLRMTEGKQDERSRAMRERVDERKNEFPDLAYWLAPHGPQLHGRERF
jgi:tetratricopeptide (TPR) repeat protein